MRTHVHVIVGVPGDPDPENILRDFKAYAARKLNRAKQSNSKEDWWTKKGSKRKLKNAREVEAALHYIRRQPSPLLIWTREFGQEV